MPTTEEQINSFIAAADANLTMWQNKKGEIDTALQTAISDLDTAKANIVADETATAASRVNVEADETAVATSRANVDANETAINNTLATLQAATPETRYVQDITIGGDPDYLYPVWFTWPGGEDGIARLLVTRNFTWNGDVGERPLNPAGAQQASLILELEGMANTWSGDVKLMEIKRFSETYNSTCSHVAFAAYCLAERIDTGNPAIDGGASEGVLAQQYFAGSGFYLRGGGLDYRIVKNWPGDVSFHDGSDQLRRDLMEVPASNTRWYAEPIAIADLLPPTATLNAFVDPV